MAFSAALVWFWWFLASFGRALVVLPNHPNNKPQHRRRLLRLSAVGIVPMDRGYSSFRQDRIQNVLAKAKMRTGLEILNSGSTSTSKSTTTSTCSSSMRQQQLQQQLQQQQHDDTTTTTTTTHSETLPFVLPTLTTEQKQALDRYEIVMEQSEMGRAGSGFVVQDIAATPQEVWNVLLDFERYVETIPTVRRARVQSCTTTTTTPPSPSRTVKHNNQPTYGVATTTRASFDVSKLHFTISAILDYHPQSNVMELSLNNALQNSALQSAKGYWYTETLNDKNNNNTTRLWLLCDLTLSQLLPPCVVDVAARSAMPRASTWVRPAVLAHQHYHSAAS